jgi:DNA-binding NtrC family response regulator
LQALQGFNWTGNVRELRNLIERVVIMIPGNQITETDIFNLSPTSKTTANEFLNVSNSFQEFKEKSEKAFIEKQLDVNSWNISKTAEVLGIQRSHLYGKIKKYGIEKGK